MDADANPNQRSPATTPSLVIGGGGLGGIAWALGLLVGIRASSPPPHHWNRVVGTSAGATVGAQLLTGRLIESFDAQFRPSQELSADVDLARYQESISRLIEGATDARQARARIGSLAINSTTVRPDRRAAAVAARLGDVGWPEQDQLLITAVDAISGELVELTRNSGVTLLEAVTASCAVPAVWPVVELQGRRLMDGGMRSTCNADLAPSEGPRLVIAPTVLDERARRRLDREIAGNAALVISPDRQSIGAIGSNPFDPTRRAAAAEAGRRQGLAELERVDRHVNRSVS